MDEPLRSRFLSYLECLESGGREQVVSYLRMIEARAYVLDTLRAMAVTLKFFVSQLPSERRMLLAAPLAG